MEQDKNSASLGQLVPNNNNLDEESTRRKSAGWKDQSANGI